MITSDTIKLVIKLYKEINSTAFNISKVILSKSPNKKAIIYANETMSNFYITR